MDVLMRERERSDMDSRGGSGEKMMWEKTLDKHVVY